MGYLQREFLFAVQHLLTEFFPNFSHSGFQSLSIKSGLVLCILIISLLLDGVKHSLIDGIVIRREYFLDNMQILLLEYTNLNMFVLVMVIVETLVTDIAVKLAFSLDTDELHMFLRMHWTFVGFTHNLLLY